MTRAKDFLARRLLLARFGAIALWSLAIAAAVIDMPTVVVGTALAVALALTVTDQGHQPLRRKVSGTLTGAPEGLRLRGAFRRQSAPDTPGRPGRPRAPGQELAAA